MILGTDVSRWQDDPTTPQEIDFVKMKQAGADFTFIKASQATWTDIRFVSSWQASKEAGLLRGAYHYIDWKGTTAIQQADHFCNLLEVHGPGELPPVVDYEARFNAPGAGTARLFLKTFLERVGDRTGRTPIIYTAPYYWLEFGSADAYWRKYALWIAHYYESVPTVPAPWARHHFHQFTDKGDGLAFGVESKQIDLNWWNGTLVELQAYAGFSNPEPEPEPEFQVYEFPFEIKTTVRLNVRRLPTTSSEILGTLPNGETLTVEQALRDTDGNVWARIPQGYACMFWKATNGYYTEFRAFDNIQIDPVPVAPGPAGMFYRLGHDLERSDWNYAARQKHPDWRLDRKKIGYPQTFPIFGGNGITPLNAEWMQFVRAINTPLAYDFLKRPATGWFNKGTCNDQLCQVRQLSWGGNIVKVDRIEGDRAYLADVYYLNESPPDVSQHANTWYNTNVIHYFSVIYPDGSVSGPPVGPIRTLIIARDRSEKLYVPVSQIIRVPGPALYFPK